MHRFRKFIGVGLFLCCGLAACESNPSQTSVASPPKSELQFLDLQGFDRDLSGALSAPLPKVEVTFYDAITPSALPLRLQTWLSAVEVGGGKVKVTPPKSDITPKDPFLLISLANSLWSAAKAAKEAAVKAQFQPAQGFDADIVLVKTDQGQSVVERVVFTKRTP